jgi:hypothetical protein
MATKERWIACQLCDPDQYGACCGKKEMPRGVVKIAGYRLCEHHGEILASIAAASGISLAEYLTSSSVRPQPESIAA